MKRILLMGNPNVGKSAIFTRLTNVRVIVSNYPGTTVEFTRGAMRLNGQKVEVIDAPGTYSLEPMVPAEKVAVQLLQKSDPEETVIINIIDSTNLERNLNLTLQILSKGLPTIVVLNFWDEIAHRGISIKANELSDLLDARVVPTVAITGMGIKELKESLINARPSSFRLQEDSKWITIGKILNETQTVKHHHHTLLQGLQEVSTHPVAGFPIAIIVLFVSFFIIRFIGEGLISWIFNPLFEKLWAPVLMKISVLLNHSGFWHDIFIGKLVNGEIDFFQSFGILSTGLYIPIAAVLPYIFSFYLILSFLEDSGYLPRLAILLDRLMHQIGIHGMGIIPMMLGLGCNVPGALATRIMETRKERFISATIMAIAVPCMAQIAMIFGLLGKFGFKGLAPVFGTLFVVWLILGKIMSIFVRGESPEIFTEIPPYRFPYFTSLFKKVWMRIYWFLKEALPFVLIGVFIVNFLYSLGIIDFLSRIFGPIISKILGLPSAAIAALLIGFLRKDVAIGMLAPLGLSIGQLVTASVVLTMYFPCVATFVVLIRELGFLDMLKAAIIMILSAFFVGWVLNLIY
ncbi:MAG: ferrous iron transporter B [Candidatus Stahlbacteria bacterium]|nr:MAG: ferrous iron transporter B [Candidatus Stahlbacteria bacterium]